MPLSLPCGVLTAMSMVQVRVTLPHVENRLNTLPDEVLAVVRALPQVQEHGWSRCGDGPWRAQLLVRGPDCIATARTLEAGLRELGYDADTSFGP